MTELVSNYVFTCFHMVLVTLLLSTASRCRSSVSARQHPRSICQGVSRTFYDLCEMASVSTFSFKGRDPFILHPTPVLAISSWDAASSCKRRQFFSIDAALLSESRVTSLIMYEIFIRYYKGKTWQRLDAVTMHRFLCLCPCSGLSRFARAAPLTTRTDRLTLFIACYLRLVSFYCNLIVAVRNRL